MAFFPCVRFENQILLIFKGVSSQQKKHTMEQKLEKDLSLHSELCELYELVTKLAIIALRKGFRLIIENPYSEQHYLHRYWALEPTMIDVDRRRNGDYYKKPTQFFFLNCQPEQNVLFDECMPNNKTYRIDKMNSNVIQGKCIKTARSMIHTDYARRFIRSFLCDNKEETKDETQNTKDDTL